MSKRVIVTARYIAVNCKINSEENIKLGSPTIVGYDFYVSETENFETIKLYISKELKINNQPLISIEDKGLSEVEKIRVFSKKKIKACIKQGY